MCGWSADLVRYPVSLRWYLVSLFFKIDGFATDPLLFIIEGMNQGARLLTNVHRLPFAAIEDLKILVRVLVCV